MPWGTKVGKTEEVEVQDDVDDLFKSDDEFQKNLCRTQASHMHLDRLPSLDKRIWKSRRF